MLLLDYFNATLNQICIIHSLGLVSEEWFDANIYIQYLALFTHF